MDIFVSDDWPVVLKMKIEVYRAHVANMRGWLIQNCPDDHMMIEISTDRAIFFKREDDGIAFKLKFGV